MTKRKLLHAEGLKERRVVVYRDTCRGVKRIVVNWRSSTGARRYKVYPATAEGRIEAVAYAEGLAQTVGKPAAPAPTTLRALWTEYARVQLSKKKLRTQQMYAYRWSKWELFLGAAFDPNLTTLMHAENFRKAMGKTHAPNQVKQALRVVKLIYNWAQRMELTAVNKLAGYRFEFGDGEMPLEPKEYTPDEFRRLVASFGELDQRTWRGWAIIVIAGTQGPRIRALLHLRWDDIDLAGNRVQWARAFDKTSKERWQPLTSDARRALETANVYRQIEGYDGPWVFFSDQQRKTARKDGTYAIGVYTYQAAAHHLAAAERRAKIAHSSRRGFHGLRKHAAGNAMEVFGNPKDALDWIADTDPRRLKEYAKKRDAHQELVAEGLSGSSGLLSGSYQKRDGAVAPEIGQSEGVVVVEDTASSDRATGQI